MSETVDQRALRLIAKARVEGLSDAERAWLSTHTEDCASCAEQARQTDHALSALRTARIPLPQDLARRTQFRVRLRAQELRRREPHRRWLWLACAGSWIFGITSAPYVWRLFAWFGQRTGLPKFVWELSFGLWWTIPALFAVVVLLLENARQGEDADWSKLDG